MNIIGISCHYHDAAAALLQDGVLVAASEEERFSRVKHDSRFPVESIAYCLKRGKISCGDLDYVVFYEKPFLKMERILQTALTNAPASKEVITRHLPAWAKDKLWIKRRLLDYFGIPQNRILFSEHHMSHAASAFFCSPFEEAAVVTIDGVGEWATATLGRGRAYRGRHGSGLNEIQLLEEMRFPHSLGLFYSAFTAFLGFEINDGEYKVMGMAPYGEPRYVEDVMKLLHLSADGSFALDLSYFQFQHSASRTYSEKFERLFGVPRTPETEFFTTMTHPSRGGDPAAQANQKYADIAASVQMVTEEIMLRMTRHAHLLTGLKNVCLAGGVLMNSRGNGRIVREGPFENVFIQPAAGDAGGALGAALYVYHAVLNRPRTFVMDHPYWGAGYSASEIDEALRDGGLKTRFFEDEADLITETVDRLIKGKVVGWFQGRAEWGSRALGNRSILADPRQEEMKDKVNVKIKFREPFRPFAPAVLAEKAVEYFDLPKSGQQPAEFMLLVAPIRPEKKAEIPAVSHGGTGRVQVVQREKNPLYYDLIRAFGQASGHPVLLNTSFNLRGEPIVNTPADAIKTFKTSGIDTLIMGKHLIDKDPVR